MSCRKSTRVWWHSEWLKLGGSTTRLAAHLNESIVNDSISFLAFITREFMRRLTASPLSSIQISRWFMLSSIRVWNVLITTPFNRRLCAQLIHLTNKVNNKFLSNRIFIQSTAVFSFQKQKSSQRGQQIQKQSAHHWMRHSFDWQSLIVEFILNWSRIEKEFTKLNRPFELE